MSFGVSASSVGTTTAVLLAGPNTLSFAGYHQEYKIWNNSAQTLWLGGTSGLAAAGGYPVPAGTGITMTIGDGEAVYGIATGGTVDARVMQV